MVVPELLVQTVEEHLVLQPPTGVSSAYVRGFFRRMRPALVQMIAEIVAQAARVVTLNLGLGRDSLAMLGLLVEGRLVVDGQAIGVGDVDVVVFSDTGAEWAHSYALIPRIRQFCMRHGLRFVWLQKPAECNVDAYLAGLPKPGTAARRAALKQRTWRTGGTVGERAASGWYHLRPRIMDDYESRGTIASRGKKDCTTNNKVEPIRKLVEDLAIERFGLDNRQWGLEVRAGRRRPHLTLLGIAADEPHRALKAHPSEGGTGPWYVTEGYPLVELGIRKEDEQAILDRHGFGDALKSGCMMCPFQPVGWFWVLRETDPIGWSRVLEYERIALVRNPRMFVVGDTPLDQAVARWRERNPDATVEAVLQKSYERPCGKRKALANVA